MNTALQRPKRPPVVLDEYFTLLDNLQKNGGGEHVRRCAASARDLS